MKLNQATDYAFRMVLHMALLPSGTKLTGSVLAVARIDSRTIFAQIMRSLIAAGIMKSFRWCRWWVCPQSRPSRDFIARCN